MALKSTIFKAQLQVSDLDRNHYATHALTIARHPSENDQRMMVRLLAFALDADDALEFGRGLSAEDEPDLVKRDLTGAIELWIEVGLPDEKWVRKAASQADRVVLIAYGGARADLWWRASAGALARHDGLRVLVLDESGTRALAALAARTMSLSVTIQEGQALVGDGSRGAEIAIGVLKPGPVDPGPGADRW